MRNWGQIAFELTKFAQANGVADLDLIEGWINSAYNEVLEARDWQGLTANGLITTAAKYDTGTAAVTAGSAAVVGTTTVWTSDMDGRQFRVAGRNEMYTLTFVDATHLTLDRAYEGTDEAAAGYAIFQNVYRLPTDVKYLEPPRNVQSQIPLTKLSRTQLDSADPSRVLFGPPRYYCLDADSDEATPPVVHQVELYPIPDATETLPYQYIRATAGYDGTNRDTGPLPFVSDDAILSGAKVRALKHVKDYGGAALEKQEQQELLRNMHTTETYRTGGQRIQIAERFVRHRYTRWQRNTSTE